MSIGAARRRLGGMTKRRDPLSFEDDLGMMVKRLGAAAVRAVAGNPAERTIRDWTDPDTARTPPIATCFALDCAWRAAGGAGAPFFDTYRRLLDAQDTAVAGVDLARLPDMTGTVIREGAEAKVALMTAMLPGATAADFRHAVREVEESIAAYEATIPLLATPIRPP